MIIIDVEIFANTIQKTIFLSEEISIFDS